MNSATLEADVNALSRGLNISVNRFNQRRGLKALEATFLLKNPLKLITLAGIKSAQLHRPFK